jgi:hypothetical protein
MRGSIWLFQFGSPRDIEQAEAKTRKHQTIRKRTEPAFIEPMQCKPITELPADEKWTFEIKFDGYRCIAVKRGREVTLFSRTRRSCSTNVSLGLWRRLSRSRATCSRRRPCRLGFTRKAFISTPAKQSFTAVLHIFTP